MAVSAASLDTASLYAFMGLALPAAASPAAAEAAIAIQKQVQDTAASMALGLLQSLPAAGTMDLRSALASLQVLDPAAALARLATR